MVYVRQALTSEKKELTIGQAYSGYHKNPYLNISFTNASIFIKILGMLAGCFAPFFLHACVSIHSAKGHFGGCAAWTPGRLGPLDGGEMFYMGDYF